MASIRSVSKGGNISTTATSGTVAQPAGLADGDFLLLHVHVDSSTAVIGTPSGFVAEFSSYIGEAGASALFYKAVTTAGSEPASYTLSLSSGHGQIDMVMVACSGVVSGAQFDTASANGNSLSAAPWVIPTNFLTTTQANDLGLVFVTAAQDTLGSATVTNNATWSHVSTQAFAGGAYGIELLSALPGVGVAGSTTLTGPNGRLVYDVTAVALKTGTPPIVTVTAPTNASTISSGGPTLNVAWTVAGGNQVAYQVVVQNAAGTVTYYDSSVISGSTISVNIDAVAAGIPTDTTGSALKAVVYITSSGGVGQGSAVFDIHWGVVTCTITAPTNNSVVSTAQATATWTFASTRGFTQGYYRARLLTASGALLYDSGWTAGAGTTFVVPFNLPDAAQYTLGVQLKNTMGVPS